MDFSFGVKIEDISDYIGVAQDCVIDKVEEKDGVVQLDTDIVEIKRPRTKGHFNQIQTDKSKKTAKITLDDCLACSGCVTSADTILIQQQSADEFYAKLKSMCESTVVIVTVSPQTRVSLAHKFQMSEVQIMKKLTYFFKKTHGVHYVLDSNCSLDISLLEAREEFVSRYQKSENLPVLCSECPGWICYSEKSIGADILPYLSAVKSPQAIMGSILKRHFSKKLGKPASRIYHVTIMPCFDKKLEASRREFYDEASQCKDVDCVLATLEVEQMLENIDMRTLEEMPIDTVFSNVSEDQTTLFGPRGDGGSGGYCDNIFRYAAKQLFGKDVDGELVYKRGRNNDFQELNLEVDGKKVLRFARAYGFRNIQKITQQITKLKKCKYHYIEVMACPSGCLNGGGQVKHENKDIRSQRQLIRDLEVLDHQREVRAPEENQIVPKLYEAWIGGDIGGDQAKAMFHTTYNAVKSTSKEGIQW